MSTSKKFRKFLIIPVIALGVAILILMVRSSRRKRTAGPLREDFLTSATGKSHL